MNVQQAKLHSLSTIEAEYVLSKLGCAQILWMQHTVKYYRLHMKGQPLYCDSTCAITIIESHLLHSITKHNEVEYYFISEHVQEEDEDIQYMPTDQQLDDIFTKLQGEER